MTFDARLATEAGRARRLARRSTGWACAGRSTGTSSAATARSQLVTLERPPAWRSGADGWARRHLGMIVADRRSSSARRVLLLLMRSYDLTAGLCVLALAFSAVGGGGPLLGAERELPLGSAGADGLRLDREPAGVSDDRAGDPLLPDAVAPARPLSVAARRAARWPRRRSSARRSMTALYLAGVESRARPARSGTPRIRASTTPRSRRALGDQRPRGRSKARTATGSITTRNERRRIRMALYTAVPGVLAYAIRDGIPIVASLLGLRRPEYPGGRDRDPRRARPAASVRSRLRRRRRARPRTARRAAPQPAVRARQPHADGADLPAGDRAGVLARAGARPHARRHRDRAAPRSTRSSSSPRSRRS